MKKVLFHLEKDYETFNEVKGIVEQSVKDLENIYKKAIGDDTAKDIKQLTENPQQYILNTYWEMHCSNLPDHLNKASVFESQTGIKVTSIDEAHQKYINSIDTIKKRYRKDRTPKVTANGLKWDTKKSCFDVCLDPDKQELYEDYQNLIEAVNSVLKHKENATYPEQIHLVRFGGGHLITENGKLVINDHKFALTPEI
ncbi:hypothetical protein [Aestuariivivens sediminis]|uniref:hypothetical protein n=1 Tax=Aestuariivivens sediminis TaxID=2913557 RepID=UPI001F5AAB05|nr:hypothetical protein [Aestuariivivens sediminis]